MPLSPSHSNLGRQPCWVACLLACVSSQVSLYDREYWMTYRGNCFLSVFLCAPVELTDGREGVGGAGGAKSYDHEEAWTSINHSILSGFLIKKLWNETLRLWKDTLRKRGNIVITLCVFPTKANIRKSGSNLQICTNFFERNLNNCLLRPALKRDKCLRCFSLQFQPSTERG